jgi:hypothetical protein
MSPKHYTHETPEGQFLYEEALRRQSEMAYRVECLGEAQQDIARKWGLSQSRAWQIYQNAKKNRAAGLL